MTVRAVIDASVVLLALVEVDERGSWAGSQVRSDDFLAPHLLPVDVMHTIRRLVLSERLPPTSAERAVAGLADIPAVYSEFAPSAARIWQLRDTLSAYDAWYVALAEAADVPLVTADLRLAAAQGPRCRFVVPPG